MRLVRLSSSLSFRVRSLANCKGLAWLGFRFYSSKFPSSFLALCISMCPNRSSAIRIGGSSTEASSPWKTGDDLGRLAVVFLPSYIEGTSFSLGQRQG